MKRICALCGENIEHFNVNAGGTCTYLCAGKGNMLVDHLVTFRLLKWHSADYW
jgi:hypothetical protein